MDYLRKSTMLQDRSETLSYLYTKHGWKLSQAARMRPTLYAAILRVAACDRGMHRCSTWTRSRSSIRTVSHRRERDHRVERAHPIVHQAL
eukprot:3332717-Heterocapsa_arctica.AAC.1